MEENKKKIVYVDMDNVLVDFQSGLSRVTEAITTEYADDGTGKPHYDDIPNLFSLMDPMPGAIAAMQELSKYFELYILSTAPWRNPTAWYDKLEWVQRYFGSEDDSIFYKRLIITHHKNLNRGDFLIDDRKKNGADQFEGELIDFGSAKFPDWPTVVEYLCNHR
jgi:5'(3')-deoxyribonucleotidase